MVTEKGVLSQYYGHVFKLYHNISEFCLQIVTVDNQLGNVVLVGRNNDHDSPSFLTSMNCVDYHFIFIFCVSPQP